MAPALFGSSILPSEIFIGSRRVQLGTVVVRAQANSGLSAEEWNDLLDLEREAHLARTIYAMRAAEPLTSNPR
jgi:hypothetical protein